MHVEKLLDLILFRSGGAVECRDGGAADADKMTGENSIAIVPGALRDLIAKRRAFTTTTTRPRA
jgi:hypothetical protein